MEALDIFTVRDLRQRSGELLREAEEGRLTLITKHGRPAILALPFDERLLAHGVNRALALHLFEAGQVSLAQAAKIASISIEEFIELLGQAGIPAVDYDPAELAEEVEVRPARH
jgi:prevent-host-death family protein